MLPTSINQIKKQSKKNPSMGPCSPSRSPLSPSKRRRFAGRIRTAIEHRGCTSTSHPGFSTLDRASPHRIWASPCQIDLHLTGIGLLIIESGGSSPDRAPTPMPPPRRLVMRHRGPTLPPEEGGRCREEGGDATLAMRQLPTCGLFQGRHWGRG